MPIGLGIGISVGASAQARGGGVAPFSPADISGLQLWLDATTGLFDATSGGSPVTADGSAVARWEDQSGNGRHFTQSTSLNRPLLKTSIQNSKNVVRFDGSNDRMIGPNELKFAPPVSIFAVISAGPIAAYQTIYGNGTLAGGVQGYGIWVSDISDNLGAFSSQYRDSSTANTNYYTATIPIAGVFFIGNSIITSTKNILYFNNSTEDSQDHLIGTITPNQDVLIGARADGGSFNWHLNGDIAELIIYNSSLSTINRESVRNYLNTKWAIY